jgi:hypothetical protein
MTRTSYGTGVAGFPGLCPRIDPRTVGHSGLMCAAAAESVRLSPSPGLRWPTVAITAPIEGVTVVERCDAVRISRGRCVALRPVVG